MRWNVVSLIENLLPFFLSCATLKRLLLCVPTVERDLPYISRIKQYALEKQEQRLWYVEDDWPRWDFDPSKWMDGYPILDMV